MMRALITIGICCLLFNTQLTAHGELSKQIEHVSKHIKKDPDNAELYLKRGQLHAKHEDPEAAKKDYLRARELNSDLVITDLLMGQLLADQQQPDAALPYINAFLNIHPQHPHAFITRAGIHQQLGQAKKGRNDMEAALTNLKEPTPGHYISMTDAVLLADQSNITEAMEWLNKGEEKFGFDIVLKSKEVDVYTQAGQYDQAITTIDDIIEKFPRKEKWLFQKALIYEEAGNTEMAMNHYQATLNTIQDLPKRLQKTSRVKALKKQALEKVGLPATQ